MDILAAMNAPDLLGASIRDPRPWAAWRAFYAALFGLPLEGDDLELYRRCTGRTTPPAAPFTEAWLVIGRRGGKSAALARIAVYLATLRDWRPCLAPGEVGTIMILAADRRQARSVLRYVKGALAASPVLRERVIRETEEGVELAGSVAIEVHTASFRTARGYTAIAVIADEIAFWRTDDNAAQPDREILAALRPAMSTVPGALLLCASSPYAQKGELHAIFRRYFAKDDAPVLVWRADTKTMNPTVPDSVIAAAYERDPDSARAEYGAEFRSDIEDFLSRAAIDACVATGRRELPWVPGLSYTVFVDPSGGARDSMTLAVAHREGARSVLDCVREVRPPFNPDTVAREFADVAKAYRCGTVRGDRYAGEWPRERFRAHGISYEIADKNRSEIYGALLPLINAGRAELLDHPRLIHQLAGLERRTSRAGKDSIDHAPGGHDDVANAAAGALVAVEAPTEIRRTFALRF